MIASKGVLAGFRSGEMNPGTVMMTLARRVVKGKENDGLIGMYHVWKRFV